MQSPWTEDDAPCCRSELALRAYSSRLLDGDDSLVLHGSGNTHDAQCITFARRADLAEISQQGPAPPQHAVYTGSAKDRLYGLGHIAQAIETKKVFKNKYLYTPS